MNTTEPLTITLAIERPGEPVQSHTFRGAKALVGRETGEIVLRDAESSALHAELDCSQGAVVVRDLGSSNGTWRRKLDEAGHESWERLPQFALLVGGAFRCGATVVRLVATDAATPIAAGQTLVSGSREPAATATPAPSSTTLPWAASLTTSAAAGSAATPSRAATLPGTPERTIVGRPPAPHGTAAIPSATVDPGPVRSGATVPGGPIAATAGVAETTAGAVEPGPPAPPAAVAPAAIAPAAVAPAAIAPAAIAPAAIVGRPPVANALIRPGGRPLTGPTATVTGGPRRRLRAFGLGALVLALVAAVGGGIWWAVRHFTGGPAALAVTVARELPDDALGFVAFASPRTQLDLLGDSVPAAMRTEATETWGIDPFAAAGWEAVGVDLDGPVGIALLELGQPTFAISFGIQDLATLRTALPGLIAGLAQVPPPTISDRSFGALPGLWIEEPRPVAIVLRDRRATAVFGPAPADAGAIARHAERIAAVDRDSSLAARPGFRDLGAEPGAPLIFAYVDGVSMRSAVPAGAPALLAMRTGFGEIDALTVSVAADGPRMHATWQTVLREGSTGLKYLGDTQRSGRALARVPGPALAAFDMAIAAGPVIETTTAFATLAGVYAPAETSFKAATGLDLRADVVDNIGGEFGVVLGALPSAKGATDFAAVGYASVKDTAKAAKSLDTGLAALTRLVFEVPASSETTGDVVVHTFLVPMGDASIPVAIFVAADHVWIAAGATDVRAIIEGTGTSIRDGARHDAIRSATDTGDVASGYLDVRGLLAAADPLLGEGDRSERTAAEPLLAPVEVVTLRAGMRGRASKMAITLHTSVGEAAPTLVRAALQIAGEAAAKAVGRARRVTDCAALLGVLETIAKTDTSRTLLDFSLRFDLRDACEEKATAPQLACALAAKRFADVEACGGAEAGLLPPDPEPQAVPYVEDIWPNTRSSAGDRGVPRPEVNYGVALGEAPQFRGRADALVTIVEFGDFQCPYCRQSTATLDDVLARHGDDVRVAFRHNPLPIHADARAAAEAALAAARQDKFWPMHDRLFDSQLELSAGKYREYATALGLDVERFDRDLADPALERQLQDDVDTAKRFGVTGTPAFFVNGRFLSGAQPAGVFDRVIAEELARARTFVGRRGNTRKGLYDDMSSRWATEAGRVADVALPPDSGERIDIDTTGMPTKGATGFARIKLVECGDFQCPYCQRATRTIARILADYPTQVALSFAHNPLSFHANAEPAARAAAAAAAQGKFWEMHDKLFADPDALSEARFEQYAKELKLDVDVFKADFASAPIAAMVAEQKKRCVESGGASTPTFFLNGRRIEGAQSFETFKALIDAELLGGI